MQKLKEILLILLMLEQREYLQLIAECQDFSNTKVRQKRTFTKKTTQHTQMIGVKICNTQSNKTLR